jgi:hypothetical protein
MNHVSTRVLAVAVLVALAVGFAAGYAWRRHRYPTPAEQWDKTSREMRKGLFGE